MKEQKLTNLKFIIDQLVEKKNGEYADKKVNLVSNVFVLNNMVFLDADEADKMLGLIVDYVIGITNAESTVLLTLKQSASTNADFASYEFSIRSNDVCIEDADFKQEVTSDEKLVSVKEMLNKFGGSLTGEVNVKGFIAQVNFAFKREEQTENNMSSLELQIQKGIKEIASGKTILVVEDNELNEELAREVLTEVGFHVEAVNSGSDAIDIIKEKAEGYYDLVLMDIVMPEMDGYTTTTLIRGIDRPDIQKLTIVALSSNAMDIDKQLAFESGMNGHVAKPLDVKKVVEYLK